MIHSSNDSVQRFMPPEFKILDSMNMEGNTVFAVKLPNDILKGKTILIKGEQQLMNVSWSLCAHPKRSVLKTLPSILQSLATIL